MVAWIGYVSYSVEIPGPSKRGLSGSLNNMYYVFGYMVASGLAFLWPDWREFTLAIGILSGISIFTAPFFPESPQFLYARNRYDAGRSVLAKLAKKTDTTISEEDFDAFENQLQRDIEIVDEEKRKFTFFDLFRSRHMALITINLSVAFMQWDDNIPNNGSIKLIITM